MLRDSERPLLASVLSGAVFVTLANAVAVTLSVPWPEGGLPVRFGQHFFDATHCCGIGGLVLAVGVGVTRIADRRRWLRWALLATLLIAATAWLNEIMIHRSALRLSTQLGLAGSAVAPTTLRVILVLAWGLAPIGIAAAGRRLARHRIGLGLAVLLAIAGSIAARKLLDDGYEGFHVATALLSGVLFGASLSRAPPRPNIAAMLLVGATLVSLSWAPSNRIRLELFRDNAAPAWILTGLWSSPDVETHAKIEPPATKAKRPREIHARPVVVLVTIDGVRGDVVASGKAFADLRDRSAYFSRAYAPSSGTAVSLTTMFNGRYFSQLRWEPYGSGRYRFLYALDNDPPRFPEALTAANVRTSSHLSPFFIAKERGIAMGFAQQKIHRGSPARGRAVVDSVLEELRAIGKGPAFVYAHIMDPHAPYNLGADNSGSAYERYVSEVRLTEALVAEVVEELETRFPRRGYLIVSSDHGEAFGEHGSRFHSSTLYEEMLHVPLLVWGPRIEPQEIATLVGLVDIGPTILGMFGLTASQGWMGENLRPLLVGHTFHRRDPLAAEARLIRALYVGDGLKAIEDLRRKTVEVYDVGADPAESHNLFDVDHDRAAPAVARLRAFFAEHSQGKPPYRR